MGTIVQEYGPFYGEPVNGTVFGRPNGSVYVPLTNTIAISTDSTTITQYRGNEWLQVVTGVKFVAQSQDLSSVVQFQVFDDSACTTPTAVYTNRAVGVFNGIAYQVGGTPDTAIVPGASYYLRAQLINNGVAVATSDVIVLEGA